MDCNGECSREWRTGEVVSYGANKHSVTKQGG